MVLQVTDFIVTTQGGGLVDFVYNKPFDALTDLRIFLVDSASGARRVPTFTVTGDRYTGATFTITSEPGGVPLTDDVVMYRETSGLQLINYEAGQFPSKAHGDAMDRVHMMAQERKSIEDRTLRLDFLAQPINPIAVIPGGLLGFDNLGNLVVISGLPDIDAALQAAEAAAAAALLAASQNTNLTTGGTHTWTGVNVFNNTVRFLDSKGCYFGNANDFLIYHGGTHTFMRLEAAAPGNLYVDVLNGGDWHLRGQAFKHMINAISGGGVQLLDNGIVKAETVPEGFKVTGEIKISNLSALDLNTVFGAGYGVRYFAGTGTTVGAPTTIGLYKMVGMALADGAMAAELIFTTADDREVMVRTKDGATPYESWATLITTRNHPVFLKGVVGATGDQPLITARASVSFKASGTLQVLVARGVLAVTDNGVGVFTITLSNPMPGTSYQVQITCSSSATLSAVGLLDHTFTRTTTQFRITTRNAANAGAIDPDEVFVTIF